MSAREGRQKEGRKILFYSEQYYSCLNCGKCCKIWDVPVSSAEKASICKLPLELQKHKLEDCFVKDAKRKNIFTIRKLDTRCVFLDDDNLCIIHKKFGEKAKPLACRIYPFDIFNWNDGTISASFRFDCPAVVAAKGKSISEYKTAILGFSNEISASGKVASAVYSQKLDCGTEKLRIVARAYRNILLNKNMPPAHKLLACSELLRFHSKKENAQDIISAGESFSSDAIGLVDRSIHELEKKISKAENLDLRQRILFRFLVNGYVRTDEAAIFGNSPLGRIKRTFSLLRFCLGKGGLSEFMPEGQYLSTSICDPIEAICEFRRNRFIVPDIYWNYLASKLDSLHFCGYPVFGHSFEEGMRHLLLTYPVVACLALMLAVKQEVDANIEDSFRKALMIVDHTFSRSPFFRLAKVKRIEREFCHPEIFASLLL